jgi:small subunit ribosomal protein S6
MAEHAGVLKGMNEYELMYIVPTSFTEEDLGKIEKNVADVLSKHQATVTKTSRLGKIRFAYPIRRERFGHYVLVRFQAEAASVAPIDEGLRMNQKEVLRHLIVKADEVGDGEYRLVQFQEVRVESPERRRPLRRAEKPEDRQKREKEQKEGVAALEEGTPAADEKKQGIEALSAEDLQKRIDDALGDKA